MKDAQDFKSCATVSDLLRNAYKHQHVPGCFAPKDVKDYERFSFVTGEKQETRNDARGQRTLHNQMKVITKKSKVLEH